jgi:hypothetical protein
MTTFEFLASYGAARFGIETGNPIADVEHWLNSGHPQLDGKPRRPSDTWMIVSRDKLETQQRFANPGIVISNESEIPAYLRHLMSWDGTPFCFLKLEKKRLYLRGIFLTYDLRAVRVCTPRSVETFDFTRTPSESSGGYHHRIWKWKERAACANTPSPAAH